ELRDAIVATARSAAARGARPVILTMAGETDRRFADAVRAALDDAGLRDVTCEAIGPTPAAALARLGRLSGLITVRLHGLLLGALAGVPSVPVAYDDKVHVAADRLGLGDLVVPLVDVSSVDLLQRLGAAGAVERRATVRARVDALRSEAIDVATALMALGSRR
ncbi:MAG: polysaccharide pyruvyl transferase family protein, partial [Candidatus Limnocylindria bacterium]